MKVVAVEPATSPVLICREKQERTRSRESEQDLFRILLNTYVYDEIISKQRLMRHLPRAKSFLHTNEGILVGISSGAALKAAIDYAKKTGE